MRSLIIGLPIAAVIWWSLFAYGWDAVAFLMIFFSLAYIAGTIWRDWVPAKDDTWVHGDTTGYDNAPK